MIWRLQQRQQLQQQLPSQRRFMPPALAVSNLSFHCRRIESRLQFADSIVQVSSPRSPLKPSEVKKKAAAVEAAAAESAKVCGLRVSFDFLHGTWCI